MIISFVRNKKYNNLTMYRPHNQSKGHQSIHHEQIPFFREMITIIDECTKLMKEDRIYLRNRIKDYLKQLRENKAKDQNWQNEQLQLLIHIFVEANKKKSLSKIQKGDKIMDSLQIKLRKFIDNNKKQRHKKEVESFRRIKGTNPRKQMQSQFYLEKSLQKSRQFPSYSHSRNLDQANKVSYNMYQKKGPLTKYSLGRSNGSNEKSPSQSRKVSHNSYSQNSFYRQFDYLRKTNKSKEKQQISNFNVKPSKNMYGLLQARQLSSQSTKLNKSLDSKFGDPIYERKKQPLGVSNKKNEKLFKNKLQAQQKQPEPLLTKKQIDKLTQLFSHHLNKQEKSQIQPQKQTYFLFPDKFPRPIYQQQNNQANLSDQRPLLNNNFNRYEYSTRKIDQMLRNSQNILAQYGHKQQMEPSSQTLPLFNIAKPVGNDDLFTPPEFLAECRKFLFSSSKKRHEEEVEYQKYEKNSGNKAATFTGLLEKSTEKPYLSNQFTINEVASENVSANLSTNKPESQVHFRFKNISIHTLQQLLLQIFKHSHRVVLDHLNIVEIVNKCSPQAEALFQKYYDIDIVELQSKAFTFDFVATIKYFYTFGQIFQSQRDYFCIFICQILDIKKKGYVDEEDIENFYESLQSSELEVQTLQQIHYLLMNLFRRSCEVEGGSIATHWSIFYFELQQDKQLLRLKQHLNKFQFQLDQAEES